MKILIVKTSSLGDIIHAFPVLNYIKAKEPNAEISWVVEKPFASLVEAHPLVDHAYIVETKRWRKKRAFKEISQFKKELQKETFDVVFDLQGNLKSGLITSCAKSKTKVGFGYKTAAEWPNILFTNQRCNPPTGENIRDDYLYLVKQFFHDFSLSFETKTLLKLSPQEEDQLERLSLSNEQKILVCPGSAWRNKQLPHATLVNFLENYSHGHFYFLWGNPEEQKEAQQLHEQFSNSTLLDKFSLPALQHLMSRMDLVVAMDSLPLHLAGTTGTATYAFFGPSSAEKYSPQGPQHHYFQGNCPYGKTFEKRCPILRKCKTGACLHGASTTKLIKG